MSTLQYASRNFGAKFINTFSFYYLPPFSKHKFRHHFFSLRNSKAQTFLKRVKSWEEDPLFWNDFQKILIQFLIRRIIRSIRSTVYSKGLFFFKESVYHANQVSGERRGSQLDARNESGTWRKQNYRFFSSLLHSSVLRCSRSRPTCCTRATPLTLKKIYDGYTDKTFKKSSLID